MRGTCRSGLAREGGVTAYIAIAGKPAPTVSTPLAPAPHVG